LTDKQQRFCEEYLIDLNATQAAIRAGYSEKTAGQIGEQNLKKLEIQTCIQGLQKNRSERTKVTADMVLQELAKVGFSNVQDYLEGDLSIKDLTTIERNKADAVSSIKKTVTEFESGSKTVVEFKLHDKLKALDMIGRHIGFFEKDNEQGTPAVNVINNFTLKKRAPEPPAE
jgi:phage terminase small subunit